MLGLPTCERSPDTPYPPGASISRRLQSAACWRLIHVFRQRKLPQYGFLCRHPGPSSYGTAGSSPLCGLAYKSGLPILDESDREPVHGCLHLSFLGTAS